MPPKNYDEHDMSIEGRLTRIETKLDFLMENRQIARQWRYIAVGGLFTGLIGAGLSILLWYGGIN